MGTNSHMTSIGVRDPEIQCTREQVSECVSVCMCSYTRKLIRMKVVLELF